MLNAETQQTLEALFGKEQLTTNPIELITYEVDAGLHRGKPDGVVLVRSTEDVVRVVKWAAEQHVPIIARSAGTGLSGGAVPSHGGIVVSFSRLNQVLEIDEAARLAVVQPGIINLTLDTLVKRRGLYYPPDPASQRASTIGGNIAENAGGPHCFKYGVTTNYVMALKVVLADGTLAHTGGRAYDYPGYDFTGVLTGSEGTLALATEATLRLIRNPPGVKTLTATFESIEVAGQAVSAIIAAGLVPAALEMLDRNILGIIEDYVHAGLPVDAAAMLLLEVDGYPASLDAQIEQVVAVLKRQGALTIRVYTPTEREQIWAARKSAFGAMARLSPAYFQVDGTVPRSKLAETLAEINQMCARRGLKVGYVFHAGDGNLHPLIPFDPTDEEMTRKVYEVGDEFLSLAVSKDGAITGEHGVGLEKRKFMRLMYNGDELDAMRELKEVFDPQGMFNPGKIFPDDAPVSRQQYSVLRKELELPPVLIPESEEQAAELMRAAQGRGRKMVIRSSSQARAPQDAILLSTERLRGVVTFAPDDLYITARAGTPLCDLQTVLAAKNLWVPLATPWAEGTLGGIVSTALNSPSRARYGSVRDQVLGLRVILPDGRRVRFGRPIVKNVAGYDMPKLFVGAHGTLGLVTEVTFKVTALPRARRSLVISVPDLATGAEWADKASSLALVASAIVLGKISNSQLPITNYSERSGDPAYFAGQSPISLVYTAESFAQDVDAELRAVTDALRAMGAENIFETETFSGLDLWANLLRPAPSYVRVGVPPKTLSPFLAENQAALGDDYVVDWASGLIYATNAADISALRNAARTSGGYAIVVSANGVDARGYSPDMLPLMKRLKARWDPSGYLNTGEFMIG